MASSDEASAPALPELDITTFHHDQIGNEVMLMPANPSWNKSYVDDARGDEHEPDTLLIPLTWRQLSLLNRGMHGNDDESNRASDEALQLLWSSGALARLLIKEPVAPKATENSLHWMWSRMIDHLRQPANGNATYWFFCEHQCSPYHDSNCYLVRQTENQIYSLMVAILHPDQVLRGKAGITAGDIIEEWRAVPAFYSSSSGPSALADLKPVSPDMSAATLAISCEGACPEADTLGSAIHLANVMGKAVFQYYTEIHSLVLRCEAAMQGIWMKKNRKQRRNLLLLAAKRCPYDPWGGHNLPEQHRPECHSGLWDCKKMPHDALNLPAFWVPHLNLENLCEGTTLLVFLKSRGRHLSSVFARQDHDGCSIIRRQGEKKLKKAVGFNAGSPDSCANCPTLPFPILPGFVMLFEGAETAGKYAKIYQGNQIPNELCFPVDEGLAVEKIHLFTYSFLRSLCLTLLECLHDAPTAKVITEGNWLLTATECLEEREPALPDASDTLPSISRILRIASYKSPTGMDLALLETLVSSRTSEAYDDVWALRSDPGYMREVLAKEMAHSALHIGGPNGKISPDVIEGKGPAFFWMTIYDEHMKHSVPNT